VPDINLYIKVLESASEIIYCPPPYTNFDVSNSFYESTLLSVCELNGIALTNAPLDIYNAQTEIMLELQDFRKSDYPQIWIAGGSDTWGVGLEENSQRYGDIIAKELNMPVSTLAAGGASIMWCADQILRSDIRKNDIVIIGLTPGGRFPYYNLKEIKHINVSTLLEDSKLEKEIDIKILDHPTIRYAVVLAVYQVLNFCNKIGAKLIIAGISIDLELWFHLKNIQNYTHLANIDFSYKFLDYGFDNMHPGPITHKLYANQILKKLNEYTAADSTK
jgi:hypothetical protein